MIRRVSTRARDGLSLTACVVNVLRQYPDEPPSQQADRVKWLAAKRGVPYVAHEITEELIRCRRYT